MTPQRAQRARPALAAGEVDDHVDAAGAAPVAGLAVEPDDLVDEVVPGDVDDLVGPQRLELCELVRGAAAGGYVGAPQLAELHRARPDAAAGVEHKHLLPGLDLAPRHHHAVGGAIGHGQRRRGLEADAIGPGDELMGGDAGELGEAAGDGLPHHAALFPVDGVDHDPVARLPPPHLRPHLDDLAGHVAAADHRQRHLDPRHAAQGEDVEMIERHGADSHQHLARRHLGIGKVLVDDLLEPTVLVDDSGFHGRRFPVASPGVLGCRGAARAAPAAQNGRAAGSRGAQSLANPDHYARAPAALGGPEPRERRARSSAHGGEDVST